MRASRDRLSLLFPCLFGSIAAGLLACTRPFAPPSPPEGWVWEPDTTEVGARLVPTDLRLTDAGVVVTGSTLHDDFPYGGWFVGILDLSGSRFKVEISREDYIPFHLSVLSPFQAIPLGTFVTSRVCQVPLVDLREFRITWLKVPGLARFCDFYDAATSDSIVMLLGHVWNSWDFSSMVMLVQFVREPSGGYRYAWHRFYIRGRNRFNMGIFIRPILEGFWIVGGTAASPGFDMRDSLWSFVVSPDGTLLGDTTYPVIGIPSFLCYADLDSGMVVAPSWVENLPPLYLAYLTPSGALRSYHTPYYTVCHGTPSTSLLAIRKAKLQDSVLLILESVHLPSGHRTSSTRIPAWIGYPFRIQTGSTGWVLLAGYRVIFVPWGGGFPPEPAPSTAGKGRFHPFQTLQQRGLRHGRWIP